MSKENKNDKFSKTGFYIIIILSVILAIGVGLLISYVIVNLQNEQVDSKSVDKLSEIESLNNDKNELKDDDKNIEHTNLTDEQINKAKEYSREASEYLVKDPKNAIYLINKAIDIDSNNVEYLNLKMSALSFTGKNDEIINFGEEMLQKEIKLSNLDKQSIYSALMSAYEETGKYDKALQYSDKAISISEDRKRTAIYYATKGNIHHKLNQYKKALEFYKKGSEIVEIEDEIYEAMSFFYEELGDTNGMLQFLPLLYNYNTSMKRLFNSYGDEIDQELELLNKALARGDKYIDYNFPAIHKAFVSMGSLNVFTKFKDMSEELELAGTKADSFYEDYDEEIEENPELNYSSDDEKGLGSIEFLKEAAAIYPETAASSYFHIALQYFDLKEYDEGIKYVLLSVERDISGAYGYISSVANRLYEENQSDRANMLLEIGIEIDPFNKIAYLATMK